MALTPAGNAIYLEELIELERAHVVTWSPVLELWPPPAEVEAVLAELRGAHPRLTVYRREELPARFHYDDHARIPPIVALADEGWRITTRRRAAERRWSLGEHGYDPALPSMGALFVAAGPSFRRGVVVEPFENIQVYPLLCAALGIAPVPGDWSGEAMPAVLRSSPNRGPRPLAPRRSWKSAPPPRVE
jgi:predicted AlkP superfamily pyrophosphatase or phosphodiesterase